MDFDARELTPSLIQMGTVAVAETRSLQRQELVGKWQANWLMQRNRHESPRRFRSPTHAQIAALRPAVSPTSPDSGLVDRCALFFADRPGKCGWLGAEFDAEDDLTDGHTLDSYSIFEFFGGF